jgi:hypothetical protein
LCPDFSVSLLCSAPTRSNRCRFDLVKGVEVNNDPPKVIIASKPSLQVLIDGMPQMREGNP